MSRLVTTAATGALLLYVTSLVAVAANAPPSYKADPNVYRVIFEDHNFRVIKATWQPGVHDNVHSHPLASVTYYLTNCDIRVYTSDGKSRDFHPKAGFAHSQPIVSSHFAKNIGTTECVALYVERK